uniref:CCHC-type domain-containing protein n=1 Tax=Tanacetum cinerariifolium TaxID=118510 RepID=A0A6L2L6E9_TANCI|nr:hypothetical protein [Tanacetum cinerariifolium]
MKITDPDIQYAVSIKEDTMYLCLHFTKDHKGNKINTPYPGKTIRRIQDIKCEYSGRYQTFKKKYRLNLKNDMPPRDKKYGLQLLERAHMVYCNPSRIPVDTESKLGLDGVPVQDPTLYRSLSGGLQYLTFTRPDLSYAVQQVCLYMHDPREPHIAVLKRILRYVQGTVDFGLHLYASATTSLVGYTDVGEAGCPTTRKSTSVEYRGVVNVVAKTLWLPNLLCELHSSLSTATLVYCDNVSAVYMSVNHVQHQRTKHIEIDIHFVRDMVTAGQIISFIIFFGCYLNTHTMTDVKRMGVHEALDEVRAQKEWLEEEVRTKMDLCNSLKRSQNELITKFQEAKAQSEKQAQELSTKSEELSTLSQLHNDLKSSFQEKETSVKHLNYVIEKVRLEYGEKVQKLEGENKVLVLALDEATTNSQSLKSKVDSSNLEIEDLKRIILLKDKKLLEVSDKSRASKDVTLREEVIITLEEKYRDVQDQLKWKTEQFQHLEEAHRRLQDNFKSSKAEWEKEKSLLLEEISSLQTTLDSQIRISENLQTQLRICNQALAHEESKRKLLEAEIAEYKSRFEDISSDYHEAKATIQKLSHKRDEEVAELRDALVTKDSDLKELGYKMALLEQENKDLLSSLKEFQESQINKSGDTGSLKKLQKKYHGLEQAHKKCGQNLKEKEVQWKLELEKMKNEINDYVSKLEAQSEQIKQLQNEVESCHCLSEVHNEEISSLVLVLKSEFSVALSKLESRNKENEVMILHLSEELKNKNTVICELKVNLGKKCEEVASLMKRVESFDEMEVELHTHKNKLAESSKHQNLLKEQIRVVEITQNRDDKDGLNGLSHNFVELEKEKLFVESENMKLATSLEACKIENQILVSKANEQNDKVVDLERQLALLETLITERTKTIEAQKQDKEKYSKIIEDKDSSIKNLLAVSEQEKMSLLQVIEDKNQKIEELLKEATDALMMSEEKQTVIDNINAALHELEKEVSDLCEKIKVNDGSLLQSSQRVEELEALLRVNNVETEHLKEQFKDEKTHLEKLVRNLEVQNRALREDIEKLEAMLQINKLDKDQYENEKTCSENQVKSLEFQNRALHEDVEKLQSMLQTSKSDTEYLKERFEDEKACLENQLKNHEVQTRALTEDIEKLEAMLQINKLDTENLKERFNDEKTRLENLVKGLEVQSRCLNEDIEKLKALLQINKSDSEHLQEQFEDEKTCLKNQLKNLEANNRALHEDVEKLQVQKLEIEHLKQQFEDKNTCLETQVKNLQVQNRALHEDVEKLEALLQNNKLDSGHLKEWFEDEKLCLENQVKNLEAQNQVLHEDIEKLSALLQINELDSEHLKQQFEAEKTCLENQVKNLEDQKRAFHEDVKKLVSERVDWLMQMEIASERMNEYCQDVELTGILENLLQDSEAREGVVNLPVSPLQKGKAETDDARSPLDMTTNFEKLDKFEGHDFRRWQKMHFLLTTLKVVYVLTTPMPELLEDATVEAIRIRAKWENDDYICRGHTLNDSDKGKGKEVGGPSVNMTEEGGKNKHHKQNKGKKRSNENNSGSGSNKKPKLECWKCGKTGHFKRDCRSSKKNNANAGGSGKRSKDQSQDQVEDGSVLYMGDEHFAPVHGKGSVALEFSSRKTVTLFNVLYVPKLRSPIYLYKKVNRPSVLVVLLWGTVTWGVGVRGKEGFWYGEGVREGPVGRMGAQWILGEKGYVHYKRMLEMSKDELIPAIDENSDKCTTSPYTPQQNGVAERKNRALKEMVNSMLSYSGLSEGVVVRLPYPKRKTLGEKGIDCIFVGYVEHSKACRPKDIIPNSDESQRDDHSDDVPSEIFKPRKGKRVRKAKSYGFDFQLYLVEGSRDRVRSQYSYCYSIEEDLRTYNEAMQSRNAAFWKEAIDDEIRFIMENNTWVLSDLPWLQTFRLQIDLQKEDESRWNNWQVQGSIALAAIHNLVIHQMDVKTAFLNGDLDKEVYMKQPEGFVMPGNEHKVFDKTKKFLSSRFSMKDMGEADVILGIRLNVRIRGLSLHNLIILRKYSRSLIVKIVLWLKKAQEKDKIGSKPDKNGKRGEAGKCQKQLQ